MWRIAYPTLYLVLTAGLPAQFFNRAVYLGPDEEQVRRNFNQREEYFIQRYAITVLPPWHTADPTLQGNGARWAAGSTTARDFTFEGSLVLESELTPELTFRLPLLQSENQDTRYVRHAFELEYDLAPPVSVFLQYEGIANKSRNDLSIGATLAADDAYGLRALFTLVDHVGNKSPNSGYERDAHGLMLAGFVGRGDRTHLRFDLAAQLPMRIRFEDAAERLAVERYILSLEGRTPLTPSDWLIVALEGEYTEKDNRPDDPASLLHESLRRSLHTVRAEWWHKLDDDRDVSFAIYYASKSEDGRRPLDPGNNYRQRRQEIYGHVRMRIPLGDRWRIEPRLIAGYVRYDEVGLTDPDPLRRYRGFEGRIGVPFAYRFSENSVLMLNWDLQLDEFSGGGGSLMMRTDL